MTPPVRRLRLRTLLIAVAAVGLALGLFLRGAKEVRLTDTWGLGYRSGCTIYAMTLHKGCVKIVEPAEWQVGPLVVLY